MIRYIYEEKQTWKQILSDFWPAFIGSHCKEKVRFLIFMTDSQRVLKKLPHIVRSTFMSGGKHNTSNLSHVLNTILSHVVLQSLIEISSEFCLIVGSPSEISLINGSPSITDQLLEEFTTLEEIRWLYIWWMYMQPVGIPKELCDLLGAMRMTIRILQWNVKMPAFFSIRKKRT